MTSGLTLAGGTVVLPDRTIRGHVAIRDGMVVSVGDHDPTGRVIDVAGLLVMPGGVDTHVHFMDPGPTEREDFPTGTLAAATRGVTTVVEHTHAHPVRSPLDLREKVEYLRGRANVDFGLAAHIWPGATDAIPPLWEAGITFFKMFTCTTHGVPGLPPDQILAAFEILAEVDGRTLVHGEDESITAAAERLLRAQGRSDPALLNEWRSREAELSAVATVAALAAATGVKATVAHVSNPAVVEVIEAGRRWGADLAAEACPQYLVLGEDEVEEHGTLRKFTPPARIKAQADVEAMWEAVRTGGLTHFSTDHAPSTLEQKARGGIWEAPFGLPGIDTTFPFLLDAALAGRITLPDVARLYALAPATRYGLAPRKGAIAPGADADLCLVDPEATWTVTNDDIVSKAGWSPYAGRSFRGRMVATWLRGVEVARDGVAADIRHGRFIPGAGAEARSGDDRI